MEVVRRGSPVKLWIVGTLLVLLLTLPACGGSSGSSSGSAGGGAAQSGGADASAGQEVAQAGSGSAGSEAAAVPSKSNSDGAASHDFDRKVVKTAELGIRAGDARRSAEKAQQLAADYGGSVFSSRTERTDGSVSAELVLLVPSPKFEKVLAELRKLGESVTTDTVKGEDVTGEYVDLKSRERNLQAAEKSLLKLYDKAKSVEDTLKVQNELTDVRGQIEQAQGRIQYLEQRTSSSRITLDIQPVTGTAASLSAWDPAGVVDRAWGASLGVLQAIATVVLSAVVFGWWLAPLLVVALVWWRSHNRRPARRTDPSETN